MKDDRREHPFWLKYTTILLGLTLLGFLLSYGKFILMPLAFSALFAMLLRPLSRRFEALRIGRAGAIIVSMVVVTIAFSAILSLFSWQFVQFAEDLPEVARRLKEISSSALAFADSVLGIAPDQQTDFIQRGLGNVIDQSGQYISGLVDTTTGVFTTLGLMPIFIFFLMYYTEMYETFLQRITSEKSHSQVEALMGRIQEVVQNYLVGLIMVILVLAVLNSIGLLIVGIEHAIFFGVFAGFMAVIPYLGVFMGGLPPFLYALFLTDSLFYPLGVLIVFGVAQFLEGNFITPRIIGSKVSINPFIAILALIVGGQIWGISGMILFVPLVGILRLIFEEIPSLRPIGYLLGNKIEYEERKRGR